MAELYQLKNEQKNWYALYTRPRWEKKVKHTLDRKNLECFCPMKKVQKQWSDRKKIVEEPLFSSYIFVRIKPDQFYSVLTTDGILNFVYHDNKPAAIKPAEIDLIKTYLGLTDIVITCEPLPVFIEHERVKITKGLFMDNTGTVLKNLNKRVVVKLDSLQQVMIVEFAASYVQRPAVFE